MLTISIYASQTSNRFRFVLDWLFRERLHLDYSIITDETDTKLKQCGISYGKGVEGTVSIPDMGLLWQKGIARCPLEKGNWENIPVIFYNKDSDNTLPFDIFSALFYLLSRYEEYYPYHPDKHNRYPATESYLFQDGILKRPIVDEWVNAFKKLIEEKMGVVINTPSFNYLPTYDIDIAYAHRHKGIKRTIGAYIQSIIKFDKKGIRERTNTLLNKKPDPYDSFHFLKMLHQDSSYKPICFILCSLKTTHYDKNIHPRHPLMIKLIKNLAKTSIIGLHPSYHAYTSSIFDMEKKTLEAITENDIHISRQHYIKVKLPETYRMLLRKGIDIDYSMGYGTHLGFRAGTGSSFLWYDIEREQITSLRIYPFCFMDTTVHYEQQLSSSEAFNQLREMTRTLKECNSQLITIFHNFSLGSSKEWMGWRDEYQRFIFSS